MNSRWWRGFFLVCFVARMLVWGGAVRGDEALLMSEAHTATLDPVEWDTVFAGETYFDAVRPMLVRFPGLAESVHKRLSEGNRIRQVELLLQWEKQEGARPQRGRHGWGAESLYTSRTGKWSVVVFPLLRPWQVEDPSLGPTFNAYIKNSAYWSRGGGRGGGSDRLESPFGPYPLNPFQPTARVDLTPLLENEEYGSSLEVRLRKLEECGLQLYKHELYDMSYRSFYAYDWSVSTGYMRIWVKTPRIRIAFEKDAGREKPAALPPVTDFAAMAEDIAARETKNQPPVRIPEDLDEETDRVLARPGGIPDWEWRRIRELRDLHPDPADVKLHLGRGFNFAALFSDDSEIYLESIRELLRMPPRTWQGHLSSDFALLAAGFADLLPPAAIDHLALYWRAWLHPETKSALDADLGGGTHRGGPTYFRGYTRNMGTMNFLYNANMGALLGGQFLNAPYVVDNARYGIENLLLRAYAFNGGAHQEIGDTYYQALTLAGAGAIAKFARDPFDRLMGEIARDRLLEPLISMYHPGLRRMTHPMGRGSYTYHMLLQEGPYHVLHSLSPEGVLMHLDDLSEVRKGTPKTWGSVYGLAILGDEGPPQRMGLLAPWVDPALTESAAAMLEKTNWPWRIFARDDSPGCRAGGWHVNYLGKHYTLASRDNANHDYGVTSIIAQWSRFPERVETVDDLSTLLVGLGVNGAYPPENVSMGDFGIVQSDNKMIAMKALPDPGRKMLDRYKEIKKLQISLPVITFGKTDKREVWINDRKVTILSGDRPVVEGDWREALKIDDAMFAASDMDTIAIHDGVTYIGLIPFCVNPLDRKNTVELSFTRPVLMVNVNVYDSDESLDVDGLYSRDDPPVAGVVVEMADESQYPSFSHFRSHLNRCKLDVNWNPEKGLADVVYRSGETLMEMGYDPRRYPAVYRRINGSRPYLPEGIERESNWAVQGGTGRLEKNGAVLESEPGKQTYLLAVPEHHTFVAYNPLPNPNLWRLNLPDGTSIRSDGRLDLARIIVNTESDIIKVDYAPKPGRDRPGLATALLWFGREDAPDVLLNGGSPETTPGPLEIDGEQVYAIALTPDYDPARARGLYNRFKDSVAAAQGTFLEGGFVCGPFPKDFDESPPPEEGFDLAGVYRGIDDAEVTWRSLDSFEGATSNRFGVVDLKSRIPVEGLASAYVLGRWVAEEEQRVYGYLGSATDAAVWVNGELVMRRNHYYRPYYPDQDRIAMDLREGENEILFRLGNSYESWKFSFRLADEFGLPLKGKVSLVPLSEND